MNTFPNNSNRNSPDFYENSTDFDDSNFDDIETDYPIRPHHRFIIDLLLTHTFRIPKPVTKVRVYRDGNMYAVCPRCDSSMEYEYELYCNRCGQHLEWSKYDEAEEEFIGCNGTEDEEDSSS